MQENVWKITSNLWNILKVLFFDVICSLIYEIKRAFLFHLSNWFNLLFRRRSKKFNRPTGIWVGFIIRTSILMRTKRKRPNCCSIVLRKRMKCCRIHINGPFMIRWAWKVYKPKAGKSCIERKRRAKFARNTNNWHANEPKGSCSNAPIRKAISR